jgi:hypothetical protein
VADEIGGSRVIHEEKHLISHAPYALRHDTFNVQEKWATYTNPDGSSRRGETPYYTMTMQAVWFRRKSGILSAHYGHLWNSSKEKPASLLAWIENDRDGRYGGRCIARWDGDNLWAPESTWEQMKEYEEFLRPMLESYPEVPPGFDGWWTFKG